MNKDFEINKRVQKARKNKGITQSEMGRCLDIGTTTYSQMERKGSITAETLKRIAEVLNIDILYLLYGEPPTPLEENPPVAPFIDTNKICEEIDRHLEGAFHQRYCFLDSVSNKELRLLQMICYLKKEQRLEVFKYANSLRLEK